MFDAPLWRDYFVMVGGGAAALTGLVFVAMSQHLSDIASDPTHRHRARTILIALTDTSAWWRLLDACSNRKWGSEPDEIWMVVVYWYGSSS